MIFVLRFPKWVSTTQWVILFNAIFSCSHRHLSYSNASKNHNFPKNGLLYLQASGLAFNKGLSFVAFYFT